MDGRGAALYAARCPGKPAASRIVAYGEDVRPHASVRCCFRDAGHILGSAIIELFIGGKKVVFSGDLGQPGMPVVADPTPIHEADVLLVESTYGNRDHKNLPRTLDEFAYAINDTLKSRRGNVVIPAFAVGRTQDVLHYMAQLQKEKRLPPRMEVYVDAPMALAATRVTLKYARLPELERVRFTEDLAESKRINSVTSGAVIISASGMCEGAHPPPPALQHLAAGMRRRLRRLPGRRYARPAHRRRRGHRAALRRGVPGAREGVHHRRVFGARRALGAPCLARPFPPAAAQHLGGARRDIARGVALRCHQRAPGLASAGARAGAEPNAVN